MATFESKFNIGDEVFWEGYKYTVVGVFFDGLDIDYKLHSKTRRVSGIPESHSELKAAPEELFVVIGSEPDGLIKCLSLPRVDVDQLKREICCLSLTNYEDIKIMKLTEIGEE